MVVVASLGDAPGLGGLLGHGGPGTPTSAGDWSAAAWAAGSGVCGAFGLVAFYAGFATAPISVVAPVAALVSAVLPVGVAIAQGERPGVGGGRAALPDRDRPGQYADRGAGNVPRRRGAEP